MEVIELKKTAVVVLALALLMMLGAVVPVMAIGPFNAGEVGNNKNLDFHSGGVRNFRGAADGSNIWAVSSEGVGIFWRWRPVSEDKVLEDRAFVISDITALAQLLYQIAGTQDPELENKWVYLSGTGGAQYNAGFGSHGMMYWFLFLVFKDPALALSGERQNPDGTYFMYNFIPINSNP